MLAALPYRWVLAPIGMLIGYFIVKAEPAVYVLNKQVEEVTDGAISASNGDQPFGRRIPLGGSGHGAGAHRHFHPVVPHPGLRLAIGISFVVPKLFTAIAFDAGGVASGPMTATFLLPLAQGACWLWAATS